MDTTAGSSMGTTTGLSSAALAGRRLAEARDWPVLGVEAAGQTHRGRRPGNEDQYLVAELRHTVVRSSSLAPASDDHRRHLLMVADGMGGHPGGHAASATAVRTLLEHVEENARSNENPGQILLQGIRHCDQAVQAAALAQPGCEGMGTTLTAAWIVRAMLYVAHVGDSRAYLWRAGELQRLTRDHTLAEGSSRGPVPVGGSLAHVLTQAVGGRRAGVDPDSTSRLLRGGDVLLLCTDGLIRGLSDADIAAEIARERPVVEVCANLMHQALSRDDGDNVTVVVARVREI